MELRKQAFRWLLEMRRRRRFARAYQKAVLSARPGPYPLVMVIDHVRPLWNPGAIIRSADAFGARAAYVVGIDHFEPRSAVSSLYALPLRFFHDFREVHDELFAEGYTFFALEPGENPGAHVLLHEVAFPEKTALVVGHEVSGLSFTPRSLKNVMSVAIAQYGSVSCLNAAAAAAVAMYEYSRQHGTHAAMTGLG